MPNQTLNYYVEKYKIRNKSIAYYPSSGFSEDIVNFPFDVIILSDNLSFSSSRYSKNGIFFDEREIERQLPSFSSGNIIAKKIQQNISYCVFEVKGKLIAYFFEDNNRTVQRIKSANLKLDCFIGLNDGCREGGNHECVNSEVWMLKLSNCMKEDMLIVRDHYSIKRIYRHGYRIDIEDYLYNDYDGIKIIGGSSPTRNQCRLQLENYFHYSREKENLMNFFRNEYFTEKGYSNRLKALEMKYNN